MLYRHVSSIFLKHCIMVCLQHKQQSDFLLAAAVVTDPVSIALRCWPVQVHLHHKPLQTVLARFGLV